ncbi:MAG: lysine--tRNA ligase [Pyrinomonadaceae bacterium]
MSIPSFDEIIEPNDQTEARKASLAALKDLVGNVYPNKFVRSKVSGVEDTITNLKAFAPVVEIVDEIKAVVATLAERERPPAELKDALNERLRAFGNVRISGRLTTPTRGNFVHLTDGINKLQIYCNKKGPLALVLNDGNDTLDEENGWGAWQLLDHGDFVGAEGYLFITNTGELSVHVEKLQFLAKALLPMPDKMHGIADPELQRRFRYADLIASSLQVKAEPPASAGGPDSKAEPPASAGGPLSTPKDRDDNKNASTTISKPPANAGGTALTTREVFERRARLISGLRRFLDDAGFIEAETPMLTPKATGAAAKPFETHHNALDIPLYARVAPELYLKRLVVGGFEKVYELNRNFRNEGLSQRHNPEFTMLEFYVAYMDVNGMMDLAETMIKDAVAKANNGSLVVKYGENEIDFGGFARISMKDAVRRYLPDLPRDFKGGSFPTSELIESDFNDIVLMTALAEFARQSVSTKNLVGMMNEAEELVSVPKEKIPEYEEAGYSVYQTEIELGFVWDLKINKFKHLESLSENEQSVLLGTAIAEVFENYVERLLINPTFVTDYPKSISPLSKASPENPNIAERFELFINGMEVANGFSELNDPKEQYERFVDQMSERERGDEEAMVLDEDYIRALSYGMPPAAGIGIGIDRLVMLLTNKHSIRDVILFPHMRPVAARVDEESKVTETHELHSSANVPDTATVSERQSFEFIDVPENEQDK